MWVGVEVARERKVSEKWTRDVFISSGCQGKLKAQKKIERSQYISYSSSSHVRLFITGKGI